MPLLRGAARGGLRVHERLVHALRRLRAVLPVRSAGAVDHVGGGGRAGGWAVVTFHVDDAEAVFAVLKPYRRRQVSEAERERLVAPGSRFRFGAGHGVQSDHSEPGATIEGQDGAGVVPECPRRS